MKEGPFDHGSQRVNMSQGLRYEPSLEGGIRPGHGCGGKRGMTPILVSYLCMVEGVGAANWGDSTRMAARVAVRAGAGGDGGGHVSWVRGMGLTRGL